MALQVICGAKPRSRHVIWHIALRTFDDFCRQKYRPREAPISSLSDQHVDWLERTVTGEAQECHADGYRQLEARELLAKLAPAGRMVLELVYLLSRPRLAFPLLKTPAISGI